MRVLIDAPIAGCLAELGKIMEDINLVWDSVPPEDFERGKEKQGMGKNLILSWEERELLDAVPGAPHCSRPHPHKQLLVGRF